MEQITVTLTKDQANALMDIVDDYERANGLRSYMELTPEKKKISAFFMRIKKAFENGRVSSIAKN
jgi:hypothetical protein